MKKLLFVLMCLFVLAGCSSYKSELNEFVDSYNKKSYDFVSVDILKEDEFGDVETEKYGDWQLIHEAKDRYSIQVKSKDNKVTGYYISIEEGEPYESYEGEGFEASQVIAGALGLDADRYNEKYKSAIESDGETITYTDNDYEVSISEFVLGDSLEHGGIVINYDKK